jgi:thiosulfate/3-mercaptopyruvate sulfurtransferase
LFSTAGVQQSDKVVTYCHVGQQGSLLFLAARYAGFASSLYDGSFEEWSAMQDAPVVGPPKK